MSLKPNARSSITSEHRTAMTPQELEKGPSIPRLPPPPPFVGCWCHGDDLPGQYVNRKEASRDLMRPILFDFRLSTRYLWPLSIQSRFSAMPQVFPRSPGDCYSHWLCSTRGRDPTARILNESFTPTVLWGFHLQHEGFHGWVQALREGSLA